jgi:carbamoyl-phosphate synthase large subunit
MVNLTKILVTGGGAPGSSGIINALREDKSISIVSCDIQNNVVGKSLADDFFQVPAGDANNFIDIMLAECKKREVDAIIPITTRELIPLSKNKAKFAKSGIQILVSSTSDLEIANNKCQLYTHLKNNGISVPAFEVVSTIDDFEIASRNLNYPINPITFKPCFGNGSRGFRILDSKHNKLDHLFNQKPNSTYMNMAEAQAVLSSGSFPSLLVSEYLPGAEYSVDCLLEKDSNIALIIPRKRVKINNGISTEGIIENNPEVISYCTSILKTLKLVGPIGIQVKYSTEGKPLLLEINPRLQGSSTACTEANVNIPILALELLRGSSFESPNIKWGTHFFRQYKDYS